jgi:hypothetical protein
MSRRQGSKGQLCSEASYGVRTQVHRCLFLAGSPSLPRCRADIRGEHAQTKAAPLSLVCCVRLADETALRGCRQSHHQEMPADARR